MHQVTRHLLSALLALAALPTLASEGGSSVYLQGTYGDFQAATFGEAGVYLRNDLVSYKADIGPRPLGGRVAGDVKQEIWANLVHLAWLTDYRILGARYGAVMVLPLVHAGVEGRGSVAGQGVFSTGDVTGQGDVYLAPMVLNWKLGQHDLTFAPGVYIPVGKYDEDRLLNIGRNYWAFDLAGSWTWLNPTRGHEVSVTAGVLFNDENPATDYRTGDEFHLDFLLGQYFSENFGVGLAGYYYDQLNADDGNVIGPVNAESFQGEGSGIGPAVLYNFKVNERRISVIGKALFDTHSKDSFDGDLYMLSVALPL